MFTLPTVVLLLLAAPNFHQPIRMAVMQFSGPGMEASEADLYSEHVATQLAGRGFQVSTAKQIAAVLGLERQKQLVGCSDSASSCFAELANALGVDGILVGEIGRLDETTHQVSLKVVDSVTGRLLASSSARAAGRAAVMDELTWGSRRIANGMAARMKRILPTPTPEILASEEVARRPLRTKAWLPAAIGLGLGAGAATLYILSNQRYSALQNAQGTLYASEARRLRDEGSQFQVLSAVALGASVASLGVAATLYLWKSEPNDPIQPSVAVMPGGAALSFSGVFP
jgi:hypothetical protein